VSREVTVADVNRMRRMLEAQRLALLEQLAANAIAIAGLDSASTHVPETRPAEPEVPAEHTASAVLSRRVKPRRVLSDAHREAVSVGKRRARAVKDAALGLAREPPSASFVPALRTRGDNQPPRLVKRPVKE
jgi:hypothetical protein